MDYKEKNGNLYKNIWRKISKSVGQKYREALRTISQVKTRSARFRKRTKRATKSLDSKRLISQRCQVGFQLAVFSFQRVANIGKFQEEFLSTVQNGYEIISHQKGDFATVQNSSFNLEWLASNGCNSFISTPNRALFEALDCWLPESKWHIACINWTPGSTPKVADITDIKNASWQISLCFPPLHSGFAYGKGLQSFSSSCFWDFHCFDMDSK